MPYLQVLVFIIISVTIAVGQVRVLHSKLEEALTNNSNYLFDFQRSLLNPTEKYCYNINLCVEVGEITKSSNLRYNVNVHAVQNCTTSDSDCICTQGNWISDPLMYEFCPYGDDISRQILGEYTPFVLLEVDPLFYFLNLSTLFFQDLSMADSIMQFNRGYPILSLELYVDQLDDLPSKRDLSEAAFILFSWVSACYCCST